MPGPGVGGFTLGGGFSCLVLPNGTISRIDSTQPDLFFALKGGLNRFGIVTSIEYYTHAQPAIIYGGGAIYAADQIPAVLNATSVFTSSNSDPKAQLITMLQGSPNGSTALVLFFYDGPTRPSSFAPFDDIPTVLNILQPQSFSSFVEMFPTDTVANARGTFHTLSTSGLTIEFLAAVQNETEARPTKLAKAMAKHSGTTVTYVVEPFLLSYGQKATDSAFPHANSPLPLNLWAAWTSAADDAFWHSAMRESVQALKVLAVREGIHTDEYAAYPNYAIAGTAAEELYGVENAYRLRRIRRQVDPHGVMGLAGGFEI
ncbi:hypothetical protein SLS58_010656 [Diplodia intermedia]|uniref:Uncharacterized protein n=1 Tax=Diplodia intermedia TaxID=856260 RepID=A0ABR3T4F1_9PEZI